MLSNTAALLEDDSRWTFHEVGVKPGEVQVGFQYAELAPTITTYGIQSPKPVWEYNAQKGIRLQGDKIMHLLIQAPKGTPNCTASFEMRADVRIGRLPVLPTRLFPRRTSVDAKPSAISFGSGQPVSW
jgi:hypothetical protein